MSETQEIVMPTAEQEIRHLYELSKQIREKAQQKYVEGFQDEAMEDACYAEGIERAILEIAALNQIAADEMDVLRILDQNGAEPADESVEPSGEDNGEASELGSASTSPLSIRRTGSRGRPQGKLRAEILR